jgi:hypothetical protein
MEEKHRSEKIIEDLLHEQGKASEGNGVKISMQHIEETKV